ncbi:MAG: 30S ribosomal protein S16 [Nitrospirae bacterium]|nr:30S ribosomal protein S16 [Nitrospirota bacterium]MBI5694337.1 30S ribosomal protein S16 [Nitrospirota bacterium]
MAVRIRLTRQGTHKRPFYRIVAADSRMPRDGRFLDILGTYDPLHNPAVIQFDAAKVKEWMAKGATASDTAKQLIKKSGILKETAETA